MNTDRQPTFVRSFPNYLVYAQFIVGAGIGCVAAQHLLPSLAVDELTNLTLWSFLAMCLLKPALVAPFDWLCGAGKFEPHCPVCENAGRRHHQAWVALFEESQDSSRYWRIHFCPVCRDAQWYWVENDRVVYLQPAEFREQSRRFHNGFPWGNWVWTRDWDQAPSADEFQPLWVVGAEVSDSA